MKFEITNHFTGAVQFMAEIDCAEDAPHSLKVGLAVKWAIQHGARLDGASLVGASLVGARLDGASLVGASLVGASLVGARLVGASLDGARLVGARLVGASLDGASLDGARLVGASLVGASLVGASLVGARLDGASGIAHRIIDGGLRSDGYRFLLTRTEPGEWRVKAGCRDYTLTDARAHWGSPDYRDRGLGHEALLIIEHMQRVAEHRQWPVDDAAEREK